MDHIVSYESSVFIYNSTYNQYEQTHKNLFIPNLLVDIPILIFFP